MAEGQGGSSAGGGGFSDLIGSLAGGITGIWQQPVAHQWASAANKHAMAFARWMDNTKYRRAVRDLRAAGLNPALAYTQGMHGSSMMGAAAQPSSGGDGSDIMLGMERGAATAQSIKSFGSRYGLLQKQEEEAAETVKQAKALTERQTKIDAQIQQAIATDMALQKKYEAEREFTNARKDMVPAEIKNLDSSSALNVTREDAEAKAIPYSPRQIQVIEEFQKRVKGIGGRGGSARPPLSERQRREQAADAYFDAATSGRRVQKLKRIKGWFTGD